MELRGFQGAWFGSDHVAYLDFPKFMENERGMFKLDPAWSYASAAYKIADVAASQDGPYVLVTKSRDGGKNGQASLSQEELCYRILLFRALNIDMTGATAEDVELRDVRDGRVVWSHYFPKEVPSLSLAEGKALLRWFISDTAARDELANFPELKKGAEKTDYFLELVDLQKNAAISGLIVKTNKGSFVLTHTFNAGDWIVASATGNQVLTYSLATGQQKGHFFGIRPSASANGLLALENESGQLSVYDMGNSQLKQQYMFSDPISFKTFTPDGNRMFVITASQTAYILDLTRRN